MAPSPLCSPPRDERDAETAEGRLAGHPQNRLARSRSSSFGKLFLFRPASAFLKELNPGLSAPPLNQNGHKRRPWAAIREAGVPIYLDTPGFDVLALFPSSLGTYCSPAALREAFSDSDVLYHAYAAGQKLSKDDLIPSNCNYPGGIVQHAADVFLAEYGGAVIDQNTGPHFTFVNVLQVETPETIANKSRALVGCFEANGIAKDKVVVSIPATPYGIQATRLLTEDGILVNLTMVAGMSHAAVCAEAGAIWITFHLSRLEMVYDGRGERSRGTKEIQNTIALFEMHKVETKIMITALKDLYKILEFPGAHGFSLTKEQIIDTQPSTSLSYPFPPQPASSLPQEAIDQAKVAKWPPNPFHLPRGGGSDECFESFFPSRLQSVVATLQMDLQIGALVANQEFLAVIREEVVSYRIYMGQLTEPQTAIQTIRQEGARALKRLVNAKKDLGLAKKDWECTLTSRFLPIQWKPTKRANKCEVWITEEGEAWAEIPQSWDRGSKAVSVNDYETC